MCAQPIRLDRFRNDGFDRGRPSWIEAAWLAIDTILVSSAIPGSLHRRLLLRTFGATIGRGVQIKPGVKVKFPWKLTVGDHAWLGERVWIDNLAAVEIGPHVCISQGAYLCTGSHDWKNAAFGLITGPIVIENGAWIAARAAIGPGVHVGAGAVLTLGGVATHDLEPWKIYGGVPAILLRPRDMDSGKVDPER